MIFIWVHHDIHLGSICMNEHMSLWALSISSGFSTYIRMLLDNIFPDLPWKQCRTNKVDYASSFPFFEGLCGLCTVPNPIRVYL